jgi:glycosyltransferase involved in cell wall biosynthesis
MITVLHLTPHLGGGVGKALSSLVGEHRRSGAEVRHVVACLEVPEKWQFLERIVAEGGEVVVAPDSRRLDELVAAADIVQLEWWNHPATIACLCGLALQPMRLLVWCHVSGLHNPIIPPPLMELSHRFLFTSPCSFEAKEVSSLAEALGDRLAVVSSGGGFEGFPEPTCDENEPMSVGYLGSLNFAKLHPNYVDYLAAVDLPDFRVRLIGDLLNRDMLEQQCACVGRPDFLEFRGYTHDVAAELRHVNVLAYLLNPRHYGTAENALLEAMAMGIVPIVLDNAAERSIVEHLRTGLVVNSPREFAEAINWLAENPRRRMEVGRQAALSVRMRFTLEAMGASFHRHYRGMLAKDKWPVSFRDIFGDTPVQWFLSCQGDPERFAADGTVCLSPDPVSAYELFEKTKGTVFHFHEYFPTNSRLTKWAESLREVGHERAAA